MRYSEKIKFDLRKRPTLHLKVFVLVLLTVLTACSWFGKDKVEYLESEEGRPLKIPAGMNAPTGSQPIVISVAKLRMPAGDELKPMPPRVVSTSGTHDSNTHMAWSAEGAYLFVNDTTESVARRLGFAIERSGMEMLEKDAGGAYKFQYNDDHTYKEGFFHKVMFWRHDPQNYTGTYRLGLEADGKNTRVYLYEASGRSAETQASERILGIFMERLG